MIFANYTAKISATVIVLDSSSLKNVGKYLVCWTEAFLKILLSNVFMLNLVMEFPLKIELCDLDKQ